MGSDLVMCHYRQLYRNVRKENLANVELKDNKVCKDHVVVKASQVFQVIKAQKVNRGQRVVQDPLAYPERMEKKVKQDQLVFQAYQVHKVLKVNPEQQE